LRKRFKVRKDF